MRGNVARPPGKGARKSAQSINGLRLVFGVGASHPVSAINVYRTCGHCFLTSNGIGGAIPLATLELQVIAGNIHSGRVFALIARYSLFSHSPTNGVAALESPGGASTSLHSHCPRRARPARDPPPSLLLFRRPVELERKTGNGDPPFALAHQPRAHRRVSLLRGCGDRPR